MQSVRESRTVTSIELRISNGTLCTISDIEYILLVILYSDALLDAGILLVHSKGKHQQFLTAQLLFQYFGTRFGKYARYVATIIYILQTIAYTGVMIYAPALALNAGNKASILVGRRALYYYINALGSFLFSFY